MVPELGSRLVAMGTRVVAVEPGRVILEGLRREVGVLALRELGGELQAAAVGRSGSDALRAMASAYRAYARAHPGRYAATLAAPAPPDEERRALAQSVLQTIFAVLEGYGLGGDDLVHATRVLRACLHGFVSLEESDGFGMPHDVDASFDLLVQALHENLSRWGQWPGIADSSI